MANRHYIRAVCLGFKSLRVSLNKPFFTPLLKCMKGAVIIPSPWRRKVVFGDISKLLE